jgi:hypothetical protein
MSRVNKVNPGKYTQAGRLSPDDSAREMAKQRQASLGPDGKGNPKSSSEAWMHQAEQARDITRVKALPPAQFGWGERLLSGLGSISAGLGALGIVAGRQATRYPQLHLQGQEARVRTAGFLMANAAAICLSVYCTQRYIRR